MTDIRVTVWNEFLHEKKSGPIKDIYPNGIHEAIAAHLRKQPGLIVKTATLEEKDHGLTKDVLDKTDCLIWWGHMAHDKVKDEIVDRIQTRVLQGMGLIILHSGHHSKIFKRMMGTSCSLCWRDVGEKSYVWVANPYHPITKGIEDGVIEIPQEECYAEYFDVAPPDDVLFISWFEGGNVFRSGMTWHRGRGKMFYFQPGHETYPNYKNENILKVIGNAVRWCGTFDGNTEAMGIIGAPNIGLPIEPIKSMEKEKKK